MGSTERVGVEWLYCYACDRPFRLADEAMTCSCGRSSARVDGGVLEISGPSRALAPVETVVRMEGGEWSPLPEDVFIRRVLPEGRGRRRAA